MYQLLDSLLVGVPDDGQVIVGNMQSQTMKNKECMHLVGLSTHCNAMDGAYNVKRGKFVFL